MDNLKIVYDDGLGGVNWLYVNGESLDFIHHNIIPSGSHQLYVTESINEPHFFDALDFDWTTPSLSYVTPFENIDKAKQIHLDNMRAVRKPILDNLDVEYIRALESGDQLKVQTIVQRKNELRDCTNIDFSNIKTFQEVKNTWPIDILGESPYGN